MAVNFAADNSDCIGHFCYSFTIITPAQIILKLLESCFVAELAYSCLETRAVRVNQLVFKHQFLDYLKQR